MNEYGLSGRELKILMLIVEAYIQTGEPVGSRLLSKHDNVNLSPATLRNIMTDLSDKKLITQPHTSAGRIPTDAGYRVYVNERLRVDEIEYLDEMTEETVENKAQPETTEKMDAYFQFTANHLSGETQMLSFVTSPYPQASVFEKLDFIPISDHKVVVVLVTIAGMVIHKTVCSREKIDFSILQKVKEYVNQKFNHFLLADIKNQLSDIFNEEADLKNCRLPTVIRLCRKAFSLEESGQLFISGVENIVNMDDEINKQQVMELLKMVGDHDMIINFLKEHSKNDAVTILIGEENKMTELNQFSVVSAPYTIGNRALGNVSVIGPKRMYYDKVYSIIRHTADRVSHKLFDYSNII